MQSSHILPDLKAATCLLSCVDAGRKSAVKLESKFSDLHSLCWNIYILDMYFLYTYIYLFMYFIYIYNIYILSIATCMELLFCNLQFKCLKMPLLHEFLNGECSCSLAKMKIGWLLSVWHIFHCLSTNIFTILYLATYLSFKTPLQNLKEMKAMGFTSSREIQLYTNK